MLAEVVGAALHVADLQRPEDRFEEGHVLEEELLLQVLGAGGDDDALVALAREAERGQQVGEGLAGAGAGLDDEVAFVGEGLLDGAGHLILTLAVLEGERGAREHAAGGEELMQRGQLARGSECGFIAPEMLGLGHSLSHACQDFILYCFRCSFGGCSPAPPGGGGYLSAFL